VTVQLTNQNLVIVSTLKLSRSRPLSQDQHQDLELRSRDQDFRSVTQDQEKDLKDTELNCTQDSGLWSRDHKTTCCHYTHT